MKLIPKSSNPAPVVTHDVTTVELNTDAKAYSRLGWWIVLIGVVGFLVWASFAPLDKGVPIGGTVTVSGNRKLVQHQAGGIVDEILVKEGDRVKAGQVLVRMNSVQLKAATDATRNQYISDRAIEARLIAERDGKASITFPPELQNMKSDPRVAEAMQTQIQLFSSRRAALQSELAAGEEAVAGLKAQITGLTEGRESKRQQLKFLKEELTGMRDLAKEGYVARNRLLDLERTYAQLSGSISEDIGNIGRAQKQVSELTLRRVQRTQEFQKEVRSMLSDVQKDADSLENKLKSSEFELGTSEVKAPVDGTVVGLAVFTRGGVVGPAFKMMEIVPSDEALVVDGMVPVNLIDKVQPGLKVELIFSAFNQNKTPHIPGVVTQVSADRHVDERTGNPYYKMQAKVAPEGMAMVRHLQLRPGMPVELFVKTGERTMMSYLLKPLFDRAKTSMTEE